MAQDYNLQDVVRCKCENPNPELYCALCQINLCKTCAGEHLLDESKIHTVIPIKQRRSISHYPTCPKHSTKQCELHCEKCDIPICTRCVSSEEHSEHKAGDIMTTFQTKKETLQSDIQELEKSLIHEYQEMAKSTKIQKDKLNEKAQKLLKVISKREEDWHREINTTTKREKSKVEVMRTKCMHALDKQEVKINDLISKIRRHMADRKKLLDSNDVYKVCSYRSNNAELRRLPPKVILNIPTFSSHQINTEQLHELFGALSECSIEKDNKKEPLKLQSFSSNREILNPAQLSSVFDTVYEPLYTVNCLSDEEIWIHGQNNIMTLYSIYVETLNSVVTQSGYGAWDITLTKTGNFLYTDIKDKTVNLMQNKVVHQVIKLQGWISLFLCSTSTDDLLVTMYCAVSKRTKIVRYHGYIEKQTIQLNGKTDLYSPGHYTKYITENRNLDICVADNGAGAVVVVTKAGKLRFRYTGSSSSRKRKSFDPVGIASDSQCRILTSDFDNNCIHILDQDGKYLWFIDNCALDRPWGLCVDTKDNLFVAEFSGKVKKIQYYK
nr:uncharacterized protein LOC117683973 [Crassostrea gigas]